MHSSGLVSVKKLSPRKAFFYPVSSSFPIGLKKEASEKKKKKAYCFTNDSKMGKK